MLYIHSSGVRCVQVQCTDKGRDCNGYEQTGQRRRGREVEDDKLIADEPAAPSHCEAYA